MQVDKVAANIKEAKDGIALPEELNPAEEVTAAAAPEAAHENEPRLPCLVVTV